MLAGGGKGTTSVFFLHQWQRLFAKANHFLFPVAARPLLTLPPLFTYAVSLPPTSTNRQNPSHPIRGSSFRLPFHPRSSPRPPKKSLFDTFRAPFFSYLLFSPFNSMGWILHGAPYCIKRKRRKERKNFSF